MNFNSDVAQSFLSDSGNIVSCLTESSRQLSDLTRYDSVRKSIESLTTKLNGLSIDVNFCFRRFWLGYFCLHWQQILSTLWELARTTWQIGHVGESIAWDWRLAGKWRNAQDSDSCDFRLLCSDAVEMWVRSNCLLSSSKIWKYSRWRHDHKRLIDMQIKTDQTFVRHPARGSVALPFRPAVVESSKLQSHGLHNHSSCHILLGMSKFVTASRSCATGFTERRNRWYLKWNKNARKWKWLNNCFQVGRSNSTLIGVWKNTKSTRWSATKIM